MSIYHPEPSIASSSYSTLSGMPLFDDHRLPARSHNDSPIGVEFVLEDEAAEDAKVSPRSVVGPIVPPRTWRTMEPGRNLDDISFDPPRRVLSFDEWMVPCSDLHMIDADCNNNIVEEFLTLPKLDHEAQDPVIPSPPPSPEILQVKETSMDHLIPSGLLEEVNVNEPLPLSECRNRHRNDSLIGMIITVDASSEDDADNILLLEIEDVSLSSPPQSPGSPSSAARHRRSMSSRFTRLALLASSSSPTTANNKKPLSLSPVRRLRRRKAEI